MSRFFAVMARLKLIRRWSLMHNTSPENDAEHSLQVAMIAHAIALISRDRYGREINPERVCCLAVYHDATEVLTGDLPTPVKYGSDELKAAYRQVEQSASRRLLGLLPEEMRGSYQPLLNPPEGLERQIVKAADKLSAYIKCLEEQRAGSREFDAAAENILRALQGNPLPEVHDFLRDYVPAFSMTIDELNAPEAAQ